ncbi:MAG: hypothetical protein H6Q48_1441 [Deltaproteobacteria bacterium]|nr:hypothetical protein [Deltaproteobacteria bacterium]
MAIKDKSVREAQIASYGDAIAKRVEEPPKTEEKPKKKQKTKKAAE